MYYLGQTVKLEWDEKDQDYNVGIILYKERVIPNNRKDADDYYGVLTYQGGKEEPKTFLYTSGKLNYLYGKDNKVYWGKTKTQKLAKIDAEIKHTNAHDKELARIVKSDLTKLNEIDI